MQQDRPRHKPPDPISTKRKAAGTTFILIGFILISLNVFFILIRGGQVSTLSKVLLPIACIFSLAGLFLYCLRNTKTQTPSTQYYIHPYNISSNQPVGHGTSVSSIDDLPPKYEECFKGDVGSGHMTTSGNGYDSSGNHHGVDSGVRSESGGGHTDSGGGGFTDSGGGGGCTDSGGGGCTDSGGGCTDSGGGGASSTD